MRKILCDRCGSEIEEESEIVEVSLKYENNAREYDYRTRSYEKSRTNELCKTCAKRVCAMLDDGGDIPAGDQCEGTD